MIAGEKKDQGLNNNCDIGNLRGTLMQWFSNSWESVNHTVVGVGRDLWGPTHPTIKDIEGEINVPGLGLVS